MVTLPSWHKMDMHVPRDAGARQAAQIDPHIEPLRLENLLQQILGFPQQVHQLHIFLLRQFTDIPDVTVWHNQAVAVAIRIKVQDRVRVRLADEDQMLRVFLRCQDAAKNTRVLFGR